MNGVLSENNDYFHLGKDEINLELAKLSPNFLKEILEQDHLIYNLICEHEIILKLVSNIERSLIRIKKIKDYKKSRHEIRILLNNTNCLIGSEAHNQKEEKVLFPELSKRIINDLLSLIKIEHDNIRKFQTEFKYLLLHINPINYSEYKKRLINTGLLYCEQIKNEVHRENYFLYPLSIKLITEKEVWQNMKNECSIIGCCSFIIPNSETLLQ